MGWDITPRFDGSYKPTNEARIDFANINGELFFLREARQLPIDQLGINETQQLNLISRALYQQAQHGYDPDDGVKSAAVHVVRDENTGMRRVFIASNANSRSRQQRPHAEVNALVFAKNAMPDQNFKVEKTYLTLFNPKGDNITPATPCGHCREDLTDTKFVDEKAELYCLPSINPEIAVAFPTYIHLDESVKSAAQTPEEHAFKMKMMDLARKPLPIDAATPEDIEYWKAQMKQGIDYAKNPDVDFRPVTIDQPTLDEMAKQAQTGAAGRLLHLEGEHGTLPRINQQLANMIKTACNQHTGSLDKLHKVRATIAVRENGDVYCGTYVDLKTHAAKPQSEVIALGNALNVKDIKEIYVMEMDENYIQKCSANPEAPKLKMPHPEALDGIMKNSHCPEASACQLPSKTISAAKHSRCMIHAIALNDGDIIEEKLKEGMVSAPIEYLLSSPFQAPSMHQGKALVVADQAKGCC